MIIVRPSVFKLAPLYDENWQCEAQPRYLWNLDPHMNKKQSRQLQLPTLRANSMPPSPSMAASIPDNRAIANALKSTVRLSVAKQLEALGTFDLKRLSHEPLTSWPSILLNNKRYILEDWTARKRGRKSWIAEHGSFLVEVISGKTEATYWCCTYCNKVFAATATTNAASHLSNEHNYFDLTKSNHPTKKLKMSTVLDLQRAAAAVAPTTKPTADPVNELILSWIISSDRPFNAMSTRVYCNRLWTTQRVY